MRSLKRLRKKTVSNQIKHQDLRLTTGSMLLAVVLISEFSLGSIAATPVPVSLAGSDILNASGVVSLRDQTTPHQSDPDCKYPPCD
ncbi:MAG: hypothetical protein WA902_22705, partial [Thermosynechococcaceae cyanobacterium]